MRLRAIVKTEKAFDLKQFCLICEETIDENPNLSFDELVEKSYKELLYSFIEDFGYEIISVNEQDKDKVLYWVKQNIKDILEKRKNS